jgi:hypothetical protein
MGVGWALAAESDLCKILGRILGRTLCQTLGKILGKPLTPSPGLPHGGSMNGHLAICSICREIMS